MGKAGQRRRNKLAQRLLDLMQRDRERFFAEWDKCVRNWLIEIHRRGALLRGPERSDERLFEVVEQVDELLCLHSKIDALVGAATRERLSHECSKVFAMSVDSRLYRLINRGQYTGR